MAGWIKLHRKSYDNFLYRTNKPHTRREAWEDILMFVNYEDTEWNIGNNKIACKKGQSVMSLDSWGRIFNWDKSRVKRFFQLLIENEMIIQENLQKTTRITVCNYDTYQGDQNVNETQKKRKRNAKETLATPTKEEEEEKEYKEGKELNNNWRDDFKIYKNDLRLAYKELVNDKKWIAERERLNPSLDVLLSIEKSCVEYWATEEGWENKKNGDGKKLNWKSTLTKALSQPMNKVYKSKASIEQPVKQTTTEPAI